MGKKGGKFRLQNLKVSVIHECFDCVQTHEL